MAMKKAAICDVERCPACGAALPPDWDEEFVARDRRFFEEHPDAKHYRRLAFPGEHPFDPECSGRFMVVEVVAIQAGVRARFGYEAAVPAGAGLQ